MVHACYLYRQYGNAKISTQQQKVRKANGVPLQLQIYSMAVVMVHTRGVSGITGII